MKKHLTAIIAVLLCLTVGICLSQASFANADYELDSDSIVLDGAGGTSDGLSRIELQAPSNGGTLRFDRYLFTKDGAIQVGWEWDRPNGRSDWSRRMEYSAGSYPANEGVRVFRAKWADIPEGTAALVYSLPGRFALGDNSFGKYMTVSEEDCLPDTVLIGEKVDSFTVQSVEYWTDAMRVKTYRPGETVSVEDSVVQLYPIFPESSGLAFAGDYAILGYAEIPLSIYDETGIRAVRKQENNMGNFCADACYHYFASRDYPIDAAMLNGGSLRTDLNGTITPKSIQAVSPFNNALCLFEISGQQLLDALEWSARKVNATNSEEIPGFLNVSGLRFTIDAALTSSVQSDSNGNWSGAPTNGYRVSNVSVWDRTTQRYAPLALDKVYHVASTDFVQQGGDGYAMLKGTSVTAAESTEAIAMAEYIAGLPKRYNTPTIVKGSGYDLFENTGRITIQNQIEAVHPGWGEPDSWSSHFDIGFYEQLLSDYKESYGTPETALKIETPEQLAALAYFSGENAGILFADKYISLQKDLDVGAYEWYPLFLPKRQVNIDFVLSSFRGTFLGNGHTIFNLHINQPDGHFLGLFGITKGVIADLTVTGSIMGGWNIGGVAGVHCDSGEIRNCVNYAEIRSNGYCAGGIAGQNAGAFITDCHNHGSIRGNDDTGGNIGGIAGWSGAESIINCSNDAAVTGGNRIGGIAGRLQNGGTIKECENTGSVSGTLGVGGVIGVADHDDNTVLRCINSGAVSLLPADDTKFSASGGIVGSSSGLISECINLGSVTALSDESHAGGIAGFNRGTVSASMNKGAISATGIDGAYCGGIVGYNYDDYNDSGSIAHIEKCGNYGVVSQAQYAGGIAGRATSYGEINNCFNLGDVSNAYYAAGIAGMLNGPIDCCYTAGTISGIQTGYAGATSTFPSTSIHAFYAFAKERVLTQSDFPEFDFDSVWQITDGKAILQATRGFEKVESTQVVWKPEKNASTYLAVAAYSEGGQMLGVTISSDKVVDYSSISDRAASIKAFFVDDGYTPTRIAKQVR